MSDLQKTPIVDVNGVVTSRNKKVDKSAKATRPLPKPRMTVGGDAQAVSALRSAVRTEMNKEVNKLHGLESSDEIASVAGRLQALAHGLEMFDEQVSKHGNIMEARAAFIEDVKPRVEGRVVGLWDHTRDGNEFVLKLVEKLSYDNSSIEFANLEDHNPWFSDDKEDRFGRFEEALNDHAFYYRNLGAISPNEPEGITRLRREVRFGTLNTLRDEWQKAVNESSTLAEAARKFETNANKLITKAYLTKDEGSIPVIENVMQSARKILLDS